MNRPYERCIVIQETDPPPLDVRKLLRAHGLRPRKSLGQNFLIDPAALRQVVEVSEISPQDVVLEVGPGLGNLTRYLAARARKVVAVEADGRLFPPLREVLSAYSNVVLVQGDILRLNPESLVGVSGYLVVANIPYHITSALIRHLLEAADRPERLVLTVQQEVAARVCAQPGQMSLLALSVQVYGKPAVVGHIPARAFYPQPKVNSSVIRVDLWREPVLPSHGMKLFFRLAKAGFSQKRKTLRNALSGGMQWSVERTESILLSAGIDPQRRAETLSVDEWKALVEQL